MDTESNRLMLRSRLGDDVNVKGAASWSTKPPKPDVHTKLDVHTHPSMLSTKPTNVGSLRDLLGDRPVTHEAIAVAVSRDLAAEVQRDCMLMTG